MLSRFASKQAGGAGSVRSFSKMLVATEAFPIEGAMTPQKSVAPVISETKLANGIKLITKDYNANMVSLKFSIMGGSGAETEVQKGAAQLLSTASFAGNKTSSGLKIVRALDDVGAIIKSSVDREKITYDVTVMPDGVATAVETVLAAIASPPYAEYILEELKPKTKLAYNARASDYDAQLSELLHEAAFGEESTLGASMYSLNLDKLSISDVLAYRATNFVSGNVVISASGISSKDLEALVKDASVTVGSGSPAKACPYVGGDIRVRKDMGGKTFAAIGFPVPTGEASKPYAVLSAMLSASSSVSSYTSGGLFSITASGSPLEVTAALDAAVTELKAVVNKSPQTLTAIKNKVTLSKMIELEGACSAALMSASCLGVKAASIADVRSVEASAVSAAASAMLKSVPSYAVLGKTAGTPKYDAIKQLLK